MDLKKIVSIWRGFYEIFEKIRKKNMQRVQASFVDFLKIHFEMGDLWKLSRSKLSRKIVRYHLFLLNFETVKTSGAATNGAVLFRNLTSGKFRNNPISWSANRNIWKQLFFKSYNIFTIFPLTTYLHTNIPINLSICLCKVSVYLISYPSLKHICQAIYPHGHQ